MRVNNFARNLSSCLNGYPVCDRRLLSSSELARVKASENQRNYSRCLGGSLLCDSALLDPEQAEEVSRRRLRK